MRELEKIKALWDLEKFYSGNISKSDYIVCISVGVFNKIKYHEYAQAQITDSNREPSLMGMEFRVIDCREYEHIIIVHKDLIHSLLREVQNAMHKTLDMVPYKRYY